MMSREYVPDNWVLVRINHPDGDDHVRVCAGWSGGYLDGNSWRLSSGVVKVEEDDTHYRFHNDSGSIYVCRKESECIRVNNAGVFNRLTKDPDINRITVDELKEVLDESSIS